MNKFVAIFVFKFRMVFFYYSFNGINLLLDRVKELVRINATWPETEKVNVGWFNSNIIIFIKYIMDCFIELFFASF